MLRDVDKTPVTEHALPARAVLSIPAGWNSYHGARGGEIVVPGMLDRMFVALEVRALVRLACAGGWKKVA